MTLGRFESSVHTEARDFLRNPNLRASDAKMWSTFHIPAEAGEVTVFLPRCKVYLCIRAALDKRTQPTHPKE
jgi:hypothetical protein